MMWFFAVLIVLAMGGVAVVAAGKGAPLAEVYDDRPDSRLPATRPVTGEDLRSLRFSLAFRGYRMSEVDGLLDRLATEYETRERERLEATPPAAEPEAARGDGADAPERRGGDGAH